MVGRKHGHRYNWGDLHINVGMWKSRLMQLWTTKVTGLYQSLPSSMPLISQQTVFLHTPSRCIDMSETTGCRASGFNKESADCHSSLCLLTLIECNTLPDNQSEIQTHDVAWTHTHHMCRKDPTTGFWGWHSFITLTGHYLLHGWSTQGTSAIQWTSQCPGCSEASTRMSQGGECLSCLSSLHLWRPSEQTS